MLYHCLHNKVCWIILPHGLKIAIAVLIVLAGLVCLSYLLRDELDGR